MVLIGNGFQEFGDFEELSASVRHTRVQAMQTSRGKALSRLGYVRVEDWCLQYVDFIEGTATCAGDTAADRYMFLVPLSVAPGCRVLGKEFTASAVGVYAPCAEHADVTRPGLSQVVIAPPPGLLRDTAQGNGHRMSLPRTGSQLWSVDRHAGASLKRLAGELARLRVATRALEPVSRSLADSLSLTLTSLLRSNEEAPAPGRPPIARGPLLSRVAELIEARAGDPIFASEVAAQVGVSQPTLQRIFLESYGMSPARYLYLKRLYLARQRLRAGQHATVSDAAYSCGFWELSRFAKHYKAAFGERPSETLRGRRPGP